MKDHKLLKIIIIAIMIIATMQAASAIDINFTATEDQDRWIRLTPDLVATYDPGSSTVINYYDSNGLNKSININPESASRALLWGVRDADNPEDIYFVCDYTSEELCIVNYTAGLINKDDISDVYTEIDNECGIYGCPYNGIVDIVAVTDDIIGFSYNSNSASNDKGIVFTRDRTQHIDDVFFHETPNNNQVETDYLAVGDDWYIFQSMERAIPNFLTVYRWRTNGDNLSYLEDSEIKTTDYNIGSKVPKHCFPEDSVNFFCNLNTGENGVQQEFGGTTEYPYPGSTYHGEDVETVWWLDYNEDEHEMLITNATGQYEVYVFDNGVLQNENANMTVFNTKIGYALQNNAVIYNIGSQTYRLTDNFTAPSSPINETEPYYNVTPEENITYNETLFSLELLPGQEVILGRLVSNDEYIYLYDYSTPTSLSVLDNALVNDEIYKTSTKNAYVYVGTDDGVYVFEEATFNEQYHDKWGLFHSDDVYDVAGINATTAMVCDNNDEVDHYLVNNDPTGNLGGSCYDIELDLTNNIMYVDADDDGIRIYNLTNPTSPTIITTADDRSTSHGLTHGDLLDIDITNDLLLAKRGQNSFTVWDITNPESPTSLVVCNNGGAGTVTSVEIINDEIAIAGTNNGRINICDLTNPEETTNTDWYTLEGMGQYEYETVCIFGNYTLEECPGYPNPENLTTNIVGYTPESIQAIEYDGTYIHAIGTHTYVISNFNIESINLTENTPPTLDNYTISDTELLLDQETDIAIIAGNVEPEDVIRYGLKCEGTETEYNENTNGEFTCSYNISGVYNITMAVTDNYHVGEWYDETVQQVTVLDTNFTGGTLRILVIDPESLAIENVQVDADNQTKYTNEYGSVTFTTNTTGLYEVTAQKSGYYTSVNNFYADGTIWPVTLTPIGNGTTTQLIVTVEDQEGTGQQDYIVSYTNTVTYEYDYTFTDGLGKAYFNGITPGIVIVAASGEEEVGSETVSIIENSVNTITVTVTTTLTASGGQHREERNCIDNGIWLCGEEATVAHTCESNDECLSDQCQAGKCSRFNYSMCDLEELPRNQQCVYRLSFKSVMINITDFFLSNLLWMILILIILIAAGLLWSSWK